MTWEQKQWQQQQDRYQYQQQQNLKQQQQHPCPMGKRDLVVHKEHDLPSFQTKQQARPQVLQLCHHQAAPCRMGWLYKRHEPGSPCLR